MEFGILRAYSVSWLWSARTYPEPTPSSPHDPLQIPEDPS
jgi:hypothetical protein